MQTILRGSLTLLSLIFFPLVAFGQASRPPLKIGLLLPYTGFLAVVGQDATRGLELYLAKTGGKAGGREIQLLKEDTEAKPDVALTKTRKLLERDHADVLVGPVQSGEALAMRDYVHAQGVPLIVPIAGTRDLTAPPKASPWILRVTEPAIRPVIPWGRGSSRRPPTARWSSWPRSSSARASRSRRSSRPSERGEVRS